MRRTLASVLLVSVVIAASCSGDDDATVSTSLATTSTPASTTTEQTSPSTAVTVAPTVAPTVTAAQTSVPATTTTTPTTVPEGPDCDRDEAVQILDDTIELARLAPGGVWIDETEGVAFDGRTDTADGFAGMVAYECVVRLAQRTADR